MSWGVYDTQDECWLGDSNGPKLFDDVIMKGKKAIPANELARIAAQLACVQMRWPPTRVVAREYDGSGTQQKDTVKTAMTPEKALRKAERGDF